MTLRIEISIESDVHSWLVIFVELYVTSLSYFMLIDDYKGRNIFYDKSLWYDNL